MKAIVASGYGGPSVLGLQTVDKPVPGENDVLVRTHVASATTADTMMRTGKPYIGRLATGFSKPKHPIPGTGFAGVVEAVGAGVTQFQPGDRVFGETTLGFSTNAEYVTVPCTGVILHMPDSMNFTEAATFCDGPLTSINFLKEIARIQPGQKVLINGASGSLGTAAVQLAKYFGAEVTGVCGPSNAGLVRSLGADHVIDYSTEDFTSAVAAYDIIYDTIGKSSFSRCKAALTRNGQYISPVLKFPLLMQMIRTAMAGRKKAKFAASGLKSVGELKALLSELADIYSQGKLKTIIDRQFPLEKVAQAHSYIDGGHKKGNVVIIVQP